MDDDMDNRDGVEEESFADLLESTGVFVGAEVRIGDKITGKIISIGKDNVFVDTGTKIDGTVDLQELADADGELPFHVGDPLELYVVAVTENEIRLSKAVSGVGGLSLLRDANERGIPVEGKVKETCKGGFHVEMLQKRVFCPAREMDVERWDKPEEYVGKTFRFLIIEFGEGGRNIVASRRKLLEQEREKSRQEFLEGLREGSVIEGKVTRIMPYGAFVELTPGLEGMVHVSELSWSRVENPETAVQPGDRITVQVLRIQREEGSGKVRISLSARQATEDPWNDVAARFPVGEQVSGRVTRCAEFGAFVEIFPGIEGLVHLGEMSYTRRIQKPDEVVTIGETVWVRIKDVDPARRRISLSIREVAGDPWEDAAQRYPAGTRVAGRVEKELRSGFIVSLEPGVSGFLPKSSGQFRGGSPEKIRLGESMPVVVQEIRPEERKISLLTADAAEEGNWKSFAASSGTSMGALGEKLQMALGPGGENAGPSSGKNRSKKRR